MHLLSLVEGTPVPDAPPRAPRPSSDLRREVRALEGVLTDALNQVRGRGDPSYFSRLAAHLIERHDEDRRGRARPYSDPAAIWERVGSGDVILIRSSWLLRRAGFVPARGDKDNYLWVPRNAPQPLPRRQEIEAQFPEAIMPLEELKAQHRNFRSVAREAASTDRTADRSATATTEGAEAMPVVTISHVWESAAHADPDGRTLRIVAAELADGGWDAYDEAGFPTGAPTCGLPLMRCWGMEEVGVFWDWASLYQEPRSAEQTACFRRAFADMSLYFAHTQLTSYLILSQQRVHMTREGGRHMTREAGREARGWPYYEEAVSMLLKKSPPRGQYDLPSWPFVHRRSAAASCTALSSSLCDIPPLVCSLWGKVVRVTREDGGPTFSTKPIARTHKPLPKDARPESYEKPSAKTEQLASREERAAMARERIANERHRGDVAREHQLSIRQEAAALLRSSRAKAAPLAPTRFAAVLRQKAFSDGTDCGALAGLYRAVMEDGFGGLTCLRLTECGWGDDHIRELAITLREVRTSELLELDLSDNDAWEDGEALAEGFEAYRTNLMMARVPLCGLITLRLRRCVRLLSLPASLSRLVQLEVLDVGGCECLTSLPEVSQLSNLRDLDVSECFSLEALPKGITTLTRLARLNLDYCDSLTLLPDLSHLGAQLRVELIPDRLRAWEAHGRRVYDLMVEGPPVDALSVDLSFLGTRVLPPWLGGLSRVHLLNLTACTSLTDLTPVATLLGLATLKLAGCTALTSLHTASLPSLPRLSLLVLSRCDAILELPDLSTQSRLEVHGLPEHLDGWEDGGRKAFTYDPTAPPPPRRGRSRALVWAAKAAVECAPPSARARAVSDDDDAPIAELLGDCDAMAIGDGSGDGSGGGEESEEAVPPPQRLDLKGLDWGDNEVYSLAEALADGSSILGVRYYLDRVVSLSLAENVSMRSAIVLGKVAYQLTELEALNLSNCFSLQGLPFELWRLPRLREINLDGCCSMLSLPDSICELPCLTTLHLGGALKSLPEHLGKLATLEVLHAPNLYSLDALPPTIGDLAALRELQISGWSRLSSVPDDLFALPRLEVLNMGARPMSAPLRALPPSLGLATSLEDLCLTDWLNLAHLPDEIGQMKALRSVQLHGCCRLATLPVAIGQLSSLENLDMGGCSALQSLPSSVSQLGALTELNLSDCNLTALPPCVGSLPSLKRLNLSSNATLVDLGEHLPLQLEALFLNHCYELRSVPQVLSALVQLQQLALNECSELVHLPDVGSLSELTQLSLIGCGGLEAMPAGLHRLVGLMVTFDDGDVVIGSE